LSGAAGLLLVRPDDPEVITEHHSVLLQLRAGWTHQGGTWSVPGGARDSHEDATDTALREAGEETGLVLGSVRVLGEIPGVDHTDWRYTYVLALAEAGPIEPVPAVPVPAVAGPGSPAPDPDAKAWSAGTMAETEELRWVRLREVQELDLHPALREVWPRVLGVVLTRLSAGVLGGAEP